MAHTSEPHTGEEDPLEGVGGVGQTSKCLEGH